MIKKLIVLVAVLAALWAIPTTREKIVELATPLLEKLGPTGERLLTPAHRWKATHQLEELMDGLRQDALDGRRPPDPRQFQAWAARQLEEDATDPWGQAYWMQRKGSQVTLGSNGPDGVRATADDITKSAAF